MLAKEDPMSTIAEPVSITVISGAADLRRRIIAIVGASSGNLVEWYDFYATRAGTPADRTG